VSLLSALPLAMAAVALYVGFWHWRVYARGEREREQLFFALLCLGIALYDVAAAGSYARGALGAPALWQRLQNIAVGVVGPALVWFVRAYTRRGSRRVAWVLTVCYALHIVALLTVWNDWTLSATPHVTTVNLPWGGSVVYEELRHGPLLRFSSLVHVFGILVPLVWAARYVARATPAERPRARQLAVGLGIFLLGAVNDLAVTNALYSFLYLLEYTYLGMIMVMTAGMSSAVLEVARTRSELRRSLARLQRIFDSVEEVYLETTLDGRILEVSPSANRWVGKDVELRGRSAWDFYAQAEDRQRMMAALRSEGRVHDFETTTRLPDGRSVACASNLTLLRDEETGESRIVGSIRDITEQKRAEAERRRLEQRMQQAQKLESLGLLAGGIAHDFNNLLTGVLGSAELALLRLEPEHPARARVEAIRPVARRATELCRELLAYSGRARFDVVPLDLSALVREMDELLQVSVPKKTRIERDLAAGLPPIVGDATQLRQIVLNLVINAAEAMDGGGSVRISTCLRRCSAADLVSEYVSEAPPGGDYVLLEVSDAGPGMSEEVRRQLFDPFFTTKFSGRGLGLAAVLGIARGHRGTVQVVSEPGRGSSFRLFLPVADATPAEPPDAPAEAPWTGRGRVLLVDDEASVREVSTAMLAHLGFEVTVAEGGRSALELFRRAADDFALVIVDLTMPDFSGVEVVRELLRIRPATPVLVASGYSAEEGAALLEREGVRGFLAKPFSLEELRRRIRTALPPEAGR
jgi:PAS domain S-box-containing protein